MCPRGRWPRPGGGELDPAGLAAAAYLHLGLHDDGIAEPVRSRFGLGDRVRDLAGRAPAGRSAGEVLLALILD